MFLVFQFEHRWANADHTRVESRVLYRGYCIGLFVTDILDDTVRRISTLADVLPNLVSQEEWDSGVENDIISEGVRYSVKLWALRHGTRSSQVTDSPLQ